MLQVPVYLKETKKGLGIFTPYPIRRGAIIWTPLFCDKNILSYPKDVVEEYANVDGIMQDLSIFTNHSCNPNTDGESALRDIPANEEITYDYRTDEFYADENFICECGAENCCKQLIHKAKLVIVG